MRATHEESPVAAPRQRTWVGDLHLTFAGDRPRASRGTGASWGEIDRGSNGILWATQPQQTWRGFPTTRIGRPGWDVWIAGEVQGVEPRELPTDLDHLNGHFLVIARRQSPEEWHVVTDRYGTLHAYIASVDGRVVCGTYSAAVAAALGNRTLDPVGIASFAVYGFFIGDRTYFEDVKIVRPATHVVVTADGTSIRAARTWTWPDGPTPIPYDDAVDAFAETLESVVADATREDRVALPISGGLDSRSVVAALPGDLGDRAWAYSYGYSDRSIEPRIAARIAAARHLPFTPATVGPYLFARLAEVNDALDGFQDVTQARQVSVAGMLADRADAVVGAHWGDVWLDSMLPEGTDDAADVAALAHRRFRKPGSDILRRILRLDQLLGGSPHDRLRDVLREEEARLASIDDADLRIKALKTELWSFRWTTASLRAYQLGAFPRLPFYDVRIGDLLASFPAGHLRGRRLQIDYLKRKAPDLARIAWEPYRASLYTYRLHGSVFLPVRAARRLAQAVRGRRDPLRNWEVQFLGGDGLAQLRRRLLSRGRAIQELASRTEIENLLSAFASEPTRERGYALAILLTLSDWLERTAA